MTFNIHHGLGLDGKVDLERISELIKKEDIDIIALNEVDQSFSKRSNYVDQASWLANSLEMDFVFGASLVFRERRYGNALLSRLPICNHKNHIFRTTLAEPRSILETTIYIDKCYIKLLASHFSIHPMLQRKQVDFCLQFDKTPCIIMGDLNRRPTSTSYRLLTSKYIDCHKDVPSATYPAKNPKSRLDYIFVSNDFSVLDTKIIQTIASDHLPVYAELIRKCK